MKSRLYQKLLYAGLAAGLFAASAMADPAGDWAGTYIGGHLGYGWGDFGNDSDSTPGPDGSFSNLMGGGQVGHNWQHDHFVFGIEGDASVLNFQSKNPTSTFDEDWMGTIRARGGYAMDRILPYVTIGAGLTDVVSKAPGDGSSSNIEPGVAVGGGLDFKLAKDNPAYDHWFGRVEYLYVDVPNDSANVGGTTVAGGSSNNIVRVGLNYKF